MAETQMVTVALVGQPNVGKSTIFSALTGLSQHVANWPGKTSEPREGLYRNAGGGVRVVDLPGAYSLTSCSAEARITRDYILAERPPVIALIADASALERNLYLLTELLALPAPVVLGLNMLDVAEQQGIEVDADVLEAALSLPVVPMIASKGQGLAELMGAAVKLVHGAPYAPRRPQIRSDHREVLAEIERLIAGHVPPPYPETWAALSLLQGDAEVTAAVADRLGERWEPVHAILREHEDAVLAVASGRYQWIGRMVRAAVRRPRPGEITLTDRLDHVLTHPVAGLGALLAVLGLTFWLTYALGSPMQGWLEAHVVHELAQWLRTTLSAAPAWLVGLLADGVIAGAGTVLTFMPVLLIFFTLLGLLEDVGYIARAAYVTDRFMHSMGLHGTSFMPLFMGFGCNVPAVMATRVIDSRPARLLTILLAPLIPCPARLTVIAFLAPIFFGASAPLVAVGLAVLNLAALALIGFALHELLLGGEHIAFIMELPVFHAPDVRNIAISVRDRIIDFLKGAATIILVMSVVLWALYTLPGGDIEQSYLAAAGRFLAPVGAPLGLNWQMMVALLTGFVRKENSIATLGVLYGRGGEGFATVMAASITPSAALAFLVVQMLFIPCVATVAVMRQETRSWRWTLTSVGLLLVVSFAAGIAVYQVARLLP
ncbi:MAG: ferrous iron transport protein B [Chloroflexi bacterium]|nr:ferrous iron transport protein B [Chloroflexota bacterium]